MRRPILTILLLLTVGTISARNQAKAREAVLAESRGYYKEVFMDGGIALTSRRTLPAVDHLGMQMEFFASAKEPTVIDTLKQQQIFCGYNEDTNGWLLYPDGAPRYRVIYVNGGAASKHSQSLAEAGRESIRTFVGNGGSYVGTCAGAYFATAGSKRNGKNVRFTDSYLHLWQGLMHSSHLNKSRTPIRIEKKSPLLRYYDFGGDNLVDSVRHNGGGYALGDLKGNLPEGTEVLGRYIFNDNDKVQIDNQPAIWAYKGDEKSGRTIMVGSHPEGVKRGERLELMAASLLYAMDGNAKPQTKGLLLPDTERAMYLKTNDNQPEFTRIGDKQYHHFEVVVPKRCKQLKIQLKGYTGEDNFDLTLCAKAREFAFANNTQWRVDGTGCYKELTIDNPKAGRWFVSVLCTTTVDNYTDEYGTKYVGRTDVLNGVPYTIKVSLQ